jgi:predicted enzyme related to lactoylglutathione lyase
MNEKKEPKVIGIGGVFFKANDVEESNNWYKKNLGFDVNEYGVSFESRNIVNKDEMDILQWTIFKKDSDYFNPSKKEFMVNYKVQNIEDLIIKLKDNGVTILDDLAIYDYGKFIHIMDNDGNKIELWES